MRQRKDGSWEACVAFDGRRFWARGRTRAEARQRLADLKRDHAVGELVAPSRVTVAEHMEAWLEANRGNWRPSTASGYEGIVRNYIVPAWGRRKLQALTAADIARQYGRWRDAGVGRRTLAIIHARLHRALRQAVLWGAISRNPAAGVEPPRSQSRRPQLWSAEEARRFVDGLDGETWDGVLAALLIGGGLRLGEACGLRWEDMAPDASTVTVWRTRTLIRREWVEGEPKTGAGVRTVTLPGFAVEALRRWRRVQAASRLALGPEWEGETRIVTLPGGGTPGRWQAGEKMRRRARALGLPELRNHDLRHLHASILLAEGLPIPAVSARLGHASPTVTMRIYAHALKGQDAEAAATMEAAMRSTG